MVTIHTNAGALVAQAAFRSVNNNLDVVSKRVNTGFKVAGALDDASTFAVAQGLRGDVKSLEAVSSTLSRGVGVGEVALAAAETVSGLIQDVGAKITQLSNDSLTTSEINAYEADLVALTDQISNAIDQANFSGKNVLNTTVGATFLSDEGGSNTIGIRARDLDAAATTLAGAAGVGDITGTTSGATAQAALSTFEDLVNGALGQLGADVKGIQAQQELIIKRVDATEKGIGALVDADLAKESSKLQALQTQQQLAVQAISIANQGPSVLLSLFR